MGYPGGRGPSGDLVIGSSGDRKSKRARPRAAAVHIIAQPHAILTPIRAKAADYWGQFGMTWDDMDTQEREGPRRIRRRQSEIECRRVL